MEAALARVAQLDALLDPPLGPPARPAGAPALPTPGAGAGSFEQALGAAMAAPAAAPTPRGTYPHLTGDLDAAPELLSRLEQLAAARGERWTVTSGLRTDAEQQRLWESRATNPYPVAPPGSSVHRSGRAADVTIGGRAIQDVVPAAELRAAGLEPLAGDAVHVELAS
ncbi:MAG: D-alanyl-D-alanine carboxypeptidase family protein [Solirubrobacteraceae bacterium]